MDERFDVVVIGAGPAGASAAREAAALGLGSVLLLESRALPRDKTCAGGLSPLARRLLRQNGLWDRVLCLGYPIHAVRLRTPGGRELLLSGGKAAAVVRRSLLDLLLAEEAVRAGAELRTACPVTGLVLEGGRVAGVQTGGRRIRARAVIVANGVGSRFHRLGPPRQRWAACLGRFTGVPFRPHTVELLYDPEFFPRYGWLFPESPDTVNVGVCVDRESLQGRPIQDVFAEFLQRSLSERFSAAVPLDRLRCRPILPGFRLDHRAPPGVLLAGDALRLVNPFTGEGIANALASGRLAARALRTGWARGWDDERIERIYVQALRRSLEPALQVGEWISRGGRPVLHLAARLASTRAGGRLIYRALA